MGLSGQLVNPPQNTLRNVEARPSRPSSNTHRKTHLVRVLYHTQTHPRPPCTNSLHGQGFECRASPGVVHVRSMALNAARWRVIWSQGSTVNNGQWPWCIPPPTMWGWDLGGQLVNPPEKKPVGPTLAGQLANQKEKNCPHRGWPTGQPKKKNFQKNSAAARPSCFRSTPVRRTVQYMISVD